MYCVYLPVKLNTNTHIEIIHDILLFVSSKLSTKSVKKTPKDLIMPYVRASTKKKANATIQPHPPSGTLS